MKLRILTLLLCAILCLGVLAGCSEEAPVETTPANSLPVINGMPNTPTFSQEELEEADKQQKNQISALSIALADLGFAEEDILLHSIYCSREESETEYTVIFQKDNTIYTYYVDLAENRVLGSSSETF